MDRLLKLGMIAAACLMMDCGGEPKEKDRPVSNQSKCDVQESYNQPGRAQSRVRFTKKVDFPEIFTGNISLENILGKEYPDLFSVGDGSSSSFGDGKTLIAANCRGIFNTAREAMNEGVGSYILKRDSSTLLYALTFNRIIEYELRGNQLTEREVWQNDSFPRSIPKTMGEFFANGKSHFYVTRIGIEGNIHLSEPSTSVRALIWRRTGDGKVEEQNEQFPGLEREGYFHTYTFTAFPLILEDMKTALYIGRDGKEDALLVYEGQDFVKRRLPNEGNFDDTFGVDFSVANDGAVFLSPAGYVKEGYPFRLYRMDHHGVEDVSKRIESTEERIIWSLAFFDADNDGDEDLLMVGGAHDYNLRARKEGIMNIENLVFFQNDGYYNFSQQPFAETFTGNIAAETRYGGVNVADIDKDGDLDVLVSGLANYDFEVGDLYDSPAILFENTGSYTGNWIGLDRLPGDAGTVLTIHGADARGKEHRISRISKTVSGGSSSSIRTTMMIGLGEKIERILNIEIRTSDGQVETIPEDRLELNTYNPVK